MIQRAVTSVIGVALGIFATFGVPSRYLAAVVLLVIGLVIVAAVYYWLKLRPQQGGVQDNEGVASEDDFADWYAQPMNDPPDPLEPPADSASDNARPDTD